jgi:hypothetical protein
MTSGSEFLVCCVVLIIPVLVAFAVASRQQRKLKDFPIIGRHEDLYGALVEGTKMVSSKYLKL